MAEAVCELERGAYCVVRIRYSGRLPQWAKRNTKYAIRRREVIAERDVFFGGLFVSM